ncbi:hypothetical protein RJT34_18648 [Clitoria ternatea]|uniref:Uncharacterized protein n=1 Tax=Clitoria ternatea TaxID=43366 RepID=A0AAN9JCI5_CLITE
MSTSLKGWLATDNETESNGNAGRGKHSLVEVAKKYQNYMRFMPTPRCRITEQIEAVSWENVAEALKKWCGQTLHYLTYKLCKQWDGARVGSEDEEKPLHAIINWRDAEDTIWHIEQIHRLFTSPSHLAMLWLGDPQFNTFVDEAVIKIL